MMEKESVNQVVLNAIDEINEQLPIEHQVGKSGEDILFGQSGKLDSIGLVNLVVAVEQQIEEQFGMSITLADQKAMSQKESPLRTIVSLVDYICALSEVSGNHSLMSEIKNE